MADKAPKAEEPAKAEAPKHFLTICDENGVYREPSLMELNKDAQGHLMGRKKREQGVMRQIAHVVGQAMKRV